MKEMLAGSLTTNYCVHHKRVPVISVPPKQRAEAPRIRPPRGAASRLASTLQGQLQEKALKASRVDLRVP
jgi:hypothetical protein